MTLNPLIGIGLRHPHYRQVLEERPPIGWFEVHSENFFQEGGNAIHTLRMIAKDYPLSLHGVGLSLGSADGLEEQHLLRLQRLTQSINPYFISEHLSWGRIGNIYMPDLLPIPYTNESLTLFCQNINSAQDFLGREILIENPSSYIEYQITDQEEVDFLVTLCKRTGAKILLDVNNLFVSSSNHGWDAKKYLEAIPQDLIKEIHLAGHSTKTIAPDQVLHVDTHDHPVSQEVWDLYGYTIERFGPLPTLLEWDAQIPPLEILLQEASKAAHYLTVQQKVYA